MGAPDGRRRRAASVGVKFPYDAQFSRGQRLANRAFSRYGRLASDSLRNSCRARRLALLTDSGSWLVVDRAWYDDDVTVVLCPWP